jgi:hypothetical protein
VLPQELSPLAVTELGRTLSRSHDVGEQHRREDPIASRRRRPTLERLADAMKPRGLAMADGDHELRADEYMELAELDRFGLIDVARRPQHQEQGGPVTLKLGPLMRIHGVFDRELVQIKIARYIRELLGCRLIKPHPDQLAIGPACGGKLSQVFRRADAQPVFVKWRT